MRLVLFALRRPISVLVAVLALAFFAGLAIRRMPVDIFPNLGAPVIYISQPYGGMDPSQMEGFLTYYYEYHLLYVTGIEHVESRNIQGVALLKLVFHPGTDMDQALAEVVSYVNRSRAFMPPGTVPPFITRFDAGSVAVGQLVLASPVRSPGELQDIALNRVRPLFATLEGVSAPPPFGGNQRTIIVRLNPERLHAYRISPEEAIAAVNRSSAVYPSGNVRTGEITRIASGNFVLGGNLPELLDAPVRPGAIPAVYLRDIATVESGTDIITAYAHVNGKRTVYIPVTKRADASTLRVMERVRKALPDMQKVAPEDVTISLEFDQSRFVASAIRNLVNEGLLGALLTGLTVLLFLRDWRGACIVITTIPVALLGAVIGLWGLGQTINIMTLGGLALAVGVLVDEATVEIENIHTQMAGGVSRARSVLDACHRTAIPRLLAMVSVLAVFVPSFFMTGVGRQLFVPLSLAVGLAMIASYLLSSTLVPVLSTWLLRPSHASPAGGWLHHLYGAYLKGVLRLRWPLTALYLVSAGVLLWFLAPGLGRELFPRSDSGLLQIRLRAPVGTRIERTEVVALKALDLIKLEAGPENVRITTGFIGTHPPSYPVSNIHLFTSGPHEAVIKVALTPSAAVRGEELRERLRARFRQSLPDTSVLFEPGDIVGQVMSFGASAPIEVAVQGPNLAANREFAARIHSELARLDILRDLQYGQALDYPTLDVTVDRDRAGQFGLTMADVAKSFVAATSSSRFVEPNYWRDPASGNAFQIQVEIPQSRIASAEDLKDLPVMLNGQSRPTLGDLAGVKPGTTMGLVERYNMQRVVSLVANLHGADLGDAARQIRAALGRAGTPPRGVSVNLRGQIPPLEETASNLTGGLAISMAVIFLLLAAFFQSFRVSAAVILTLPAVVLGSAAALLATGSTLNIQSFLGTIMAVGIAAANSILLVSFAETARLGGAAGRDAAFTGAQGRLRAILMTASAMIAGMIPLAAGLGEGGSQTAPLGRAVIGGLLGATLATLTVLPAIYAVLMGRSSAQSASLDPSDPASKYYEAS